MGGSGPPSGALAPPPGAPASPRPSSVPAKGGGVPAPSDDSDLLEYVYGSPTTADAAPAPRPQPAPAVELATLDAPPPPVVTSKRLAKTKLPDGAGGGGAHDPTNLIAAYADEDAMCGGALFGGNLRGFDGSSSCYAPLK